MSRFYSRPFLAIVTGFATIWMLVGTYADENKAKDSTPAATVESATDALRVPSFVLRDTKGELRGLADFDKAEFLVLVFMGTQCPIANGYVPDLNAMAERYKDKKVQFIGINSTLSDDAKAIKKHAEEFKISFPVLIDDEQLAADVCGATRTPEVFVLDHRRTIRYQGRIDDRIGYTYKRDKARRADLDLALGELTSKKKVSVAKTKPSGCLITRESSLQEKGRITYAKDVASILHKRCANCHHPGTAAPFSLLTYDQARNWSEMIKETIVLRRMPPWDADPRFGHFSNDLSMPKKEIDTVVAWIDSGAPLGDKKNLPEPPKFADGWLIGKPDKIIRLEKPYKVQATGTVEYKYFKTPAPFKEDVWVQAAEARPDNRPVVHHIIAFIAPPGKRRRGLGPSVAGFAPGEEPVIYPKGMGFKIPAGYDIWWQMHYTPTGKEEVDQSEVGLIFCKEPPTRAIRGGGVFPDYKKFTIRPGMPSERFSYSRSFNSDIKLLALMPHMHLRGKDFKYILHRPNQKPETILSVPDYDFNWQHRYRFNEPLSVPKGSRLECVAHFDNSADNPANPKPEETVRWGDQTWEEMMIGWYTYVSEKEYVAPKAKLKKENSSEKKAATKRDAADAKTKGKKLKKAQSRQAELPLPRSRQRNGASTTTE